MLYAVSRDKTVVGGALTPEEIRQTLIGNGPVSVVSADETELAEYATDVDEFSVHDGLVVASHRARSTDAILTSDGVIAEAGCETVWD